MRRNIIEIRESKMIKGDKFEFLFKISKTIYNGFIELFNDKNPLHVDESFAQSKGFKSMVMHGNILGGFLSYFIGECLPMKNVIIHSQEIKYIKPVYLNQSVQFKAEVMEIYKSVNVVEFKFYFEDEDSNKIAKGKIQIGIIQ